MKTLSEDIKTGKFKRVYLLCGEEEYLVKNYKNQLIQAINGGDTMNSNFYEGKTIDTYKTISIKISDDLSGIDTYNAYLNGKWILMEYDYKTKKLVHNLSDNIYVKGKNDFKLVVTDEMNNSTTFESYFYKNN